MTVGMFLFVVVVVLQSSSSSSLLVLLTSLSLLSSSSSLSLSSSSSSSLSLSSSSSSSSSLSSSSSSSALVSIASNGSSQGTSPPQVQHCWSTNQCNRMLGHTCQRLYEGCELGVCMCAPGKQVKDTLGRCLNVRYGGEACHPVTDVCPQRMNCSFEEDHTGDQPSGKHLLQRCRCDGKLTLTDDRKFCINNEERILGQRCQSSDTCLHLSTRGYTRFDVKCSTDGVCECNEGFRREGVSCKKVRIGEYGCRATHHCDRGAVCNFQMKCVCPLDYVLVAGGSKCAKRGAIFDLPFGSTCDEINERKYCSKKHICFSCFQQVPFRCVRFLLEEEYSYLRSQSPVTCLSSILMTSSVYVTLFAT